MDGLLFKLVELDSLLSWCLFNPSLVTEAKLFLQVINFAFLIFQVSDKIVDSDFAAAAAIPNCSQDQGVCLILCPPKSPFLSPSALLLWQTCKDDSIPLSVLGRDKWMFVSPLDPVVMSPTGEATRKLIILSLEWDFYCK